LDIGGTEKQLLCLIKMIRKNYKVEVFSFLGGSLETNYRELGVSVRCGTNKFLSIIEFIFFLITNKTDIYHFFLPKSYLIGGFLTFFSKKKKIMSRRSLNNYHRKYLFISLFLERILHKRMNIILTNTVSIKKQLVMEEGVPNKKVKVIPNFLLKLNVFNLKKKIPKSFYVFGYVANFIPYKNHLMLLDICSMIKTKKKWKLFLIGSDVNGFKSIVENRVRTLGLEKKIIFFDENKDIQKFYKKIDFAVSTSSEEGSSNFLLESISSGLPIIAYDVGGNFEFFKDNGFLIPAFDKVLMKEAIENMLNMNINTFKKNSIKICENYFDNSKTLKMYSSFY
tara:strand:+ start:2145 stop:3158 length:1014 start_codon:yes stop_codon:yes gene_type:complete